MLNSRMCTSRIEYLVAFFEFRNTRIINAIRVANSLTEYIWKANST